MAKNPPEMKLDSASGPELQDTLSWVGFSWLMVAALPFVLGLAGVRRVEPPPLLDELLGQTEL